MAAGRAMEELIREADVPTDAASSATLLFSPFALFHPLLPALSPRV